MTECKWWKNPKYRPLPLIVADKWGFSLQWHMVDGVPQFAIQDWIAGLASCNTRKAAKMWSDMDKKMSVSIVPLDYVASDSNTISGNASLSWL